MRLHGIRSRSTAVNAAARRLRTVFVVVPCIFMIAMLVLPLSAIELPSLNPNVTEASDCVVTVSWTFTGVPCCAGRVAPPR